MLSIRYLIFSALMIMCTVALAGQPPLASGMLFAHTMPQPKPNVNNVQHQIDQSPITTPTIPETANNFQRLPSPNELNNIIIPMVPSATPASFEQHHALRRQAWQTQQEQKRRRQEQQALIAQHKANQQKIIIVQQPARDPVVEGFLAIPRMLGYLFGAHR